MSQVHHHPSAARLPSNHIRHLVNENTLDPSSKFGKTEQDKAEVTEWIEKIAAEDGIKSETLPDLDLKLTPRTYIVSNYMTVADVALYGALYPIVSEEQPAQYYSHPAVTRYFDHIQNRPEVRAAASGLVPPIPVVSLDLENAPKPERKAEPPKKKEKAPAAAQSPKPSAGKQDEKAAPAVEAQPADAPAGAKAQKKEKKEKKPADADAASKKGGNGGGKAASPPAEDAGEPVPSMIDLRVGHIVDIKKHPDADSLYVEQIDFGEETGPRTVVSGLVNYIPIEEMRDKYLVGVCNLKPANMRGVKSFAMVLCASSKEGKEGGIELIKPPPNSKPGDRVYFEGPDYENAMALAQLNPKKKIFETIQPGFTTLETKEAAWVNPATGSVHKIRTKDGVCVAPTLVGASLS